jgi:hypothetical protein
MVRSYLVILCFAALLVAVTDDWVAAQTDCPEADQAAAADNEYLSEPLPQIPLRESTSIDAGNITSCIPAALAGSVAQSLVETSLAIVHMHLFFLPMQC